MLDLLLRCRYDPTELLGDILFILFYYVILETQVFVYNPTLKIELVSVGIDPDHIGFTVDHVFAELFDLQ